MDSQVSRLNEIETQIKRFTILLNKLEKKSRKLGTLRAVILLSGIIIFLISYFYLATIYVIIIAALFLIVFGILTKYHNQIDYGIKKIKICINNKSLNIARINIEWDKLPSPKSSNHNQLHPFEFDLNISGEFSLHRLIDSSATREGSLKLLQWFTIIDPSLEEIQWRQRTVKELIPLTKFREKLLLNSGMITKKELHGKRLLDWVNETSNIKTLKKILIVCFFLIPLNILFIVLAIFGILTALWPVTTLLIIAAYFFNQRYVSGLFDKALILQEDTGKFYLILKFLEEYHYGKNGNLKKHCEAFLMNEKKPSVYFKKIKRFSFLISFQKNPLTRIVLNALYPWDFYQAYQLEKIKIDLSGQLPAWLETLYTLEALISLANFAYLNPSYSFPEINDSSASTEHIFEAVKIAHPLIPLNSNIRNDFKINKKGEIIIVTGSNMSGKSTFLKTVGLNLVLAFSGGAVNARHMKTNLFRIFTSINITDSVVDGISYFYAEVKRLKELLNKLDEENHVPLFFLIDEIFKGTNNKERLIGSRSYIKAICGKNGIGIISTHDLELINLEHEISGVMNYHFREEIFEDKMLFNYKIIKGPSPTTNALKVMKLEGLPID
jgi:MutS domain V